MAKKTKALAVTPPTAPAAPVPSFDITIGIHPTAKGEGLKAIIAADAVTITDKATHSDARKLGTALKHTRKDVEQWYRDRMVTPLNRALTWAREQMHADLQVFDVAIGKVGAKDVAYTKEQERLAREEADRRRREEEAREQARRDKEAAEAEAMALKLESSSNVLSAREERFVMEWRKSGRTDRDGERIAKLCGYADPAKAYARLIGSDKIADAIQNADKAAAIRRESEAKQAAPIMVETTPVESKIGSSAGTSLRVYWSCQPGFDIGKLLPQLADEFNDGISHEAKAEIERYLAPALQTLMNARARSLKGMFSRVYPMCTAAKDEKVAG